MNNAVYMLPCKPGSVYVNLGRDCLNDCRFCVSRFGDFFGQDLHSTDSITDPSDAINLGLERIHGICERTGYKPSEIVICGVGEPFLHYDTVIQTCKKSRGYFGSEVPIRADTAGLWWDQRKNMDFLDLVDSLSVSLNAETEEKYNVICQPKISNAYHILNEFLGALSDERKRRIQCGQHFPDVRLTVVDTSRREFMPPEKPTDTKGECPAPDIDACKAIADSFGFPLIVKELFRDSNDDCWKMGNIEEYLLSGRYLEKCAGCNHRHI